MIMKAILITIYSYGSNFHTVATQLYSLKITGLFTEASRSNKHTSTTVQHVQGVAIAICLGKLYMALKG